MENITTEQSSIPPNQLKKKMEILSFLEAGVFEILFIAGLLIIFFGFLNYFNILSLSTLYPKQLAWLPSQKESHQSALQNRINSLPLPLSLQGIEAYNMQYTIIGRLLNIKKNDATHYTFTLNYETRGLELHATSSTRSIHGSVVKGIFDEDPTTLTPLDSYKNGDIIYVVLAYTFVPKKDNKPQLLRMGKLTIRN